ncbi:MAG: PSD1 and planctomycete cytochrome C domain-containing protein [Bryobacteraceae bacterium]|nr:PSD1 and planctomycete cytochrome C domain-containing protein [Bryobacteraceae bacterium]
MLRSLSALLLIVAPAFAAEDGAEARAVLNTCIGCHNSKTSMSGLALDSREAILKGGKHGPAVKPGEGALLLDVVRHTGNIKMPPGGKLKDSQVAILEKWIADGMPMTAKAVAAPVHWSFKPPKKADVPSGRHPVDYFIQAKLTEAGLAMSPAADRRTLLRRVSFDLTGLPPTPAELAAFLADNQPGAYERQVDRLLASPHYGERWGRHWLDQARYADSNGYSIDAPREIWKYRDWVINAFNSDMPFDRFTLEQFAGDQLPNPTTDQLIATGFHRNTPINFEGGIDFEQYRVDHVVDRVSTTGSVYLGLTLGCARCHDHKFDPLPQKEFYQLFSFFNNVDEAVKEEDRADVQKPVLELGTPAELRKKDVIKAQMKALEGELATYRKVIEPRQEAWEAALKEADIKKFRPSVQAALGLHVGRRNEEQADLVFETFANTDEGWRERRATMRAVQRLSPKIVTSLIMKDLPQPRQAYIHLGGDFLRKGENVSAGTPAILPPLGNQGPATRVDLAKWLTSRENPLTARVTVNRMWMRYFGRGIVETEDDFGRQGSLPTHPELLDWLAVEFMDRGWSQKAMHRLIVTSATYQQASAANHPAAAEKDPRNLLLSRQNRIRLEGEIIRDAGLVASGLFAPKVGGPSVFPPIPPGVMNSGQNAREWTVSTGEDRYRRGMYTFLWRATPHPTMSLFDGPDAASACTRRNRSNSPLQALTLLNDASVKEFADALAARALKSKDPLGQAFEYAMARPPSSLERERLSRFLALQKDEAGGNEVAAYSGLARVLLNLDEFMTRE